MRLLLVASIAGLVAATATFACSSSSEVKPSADAGKDAKAPVTTDDDDDDDDDNTNPPPVVEMDGGADDAEAGTTPGGDLLTTGDGGVNCAADSFREAEGNNDEATANKLAVKIGRTTICGQTAEGDPDFITFQMPAGAQAWFLAPVGLNQNNISGTIGGDPFNGLDFSGVNAGEGATWVVKISANQSRAWRLRFSFCTSGADPECNN